MSGRAGADVGPDHRVPLRGTTPAVAIVDLGMGNLRSVARAIERAGGTPRTIASPADIARAERLVVPGQGHFGDCARALEAGAGDAIRTFLRSGRPYLGICLGMQALFASSEEAPGCPGLGVVAGTVRRFPRGMRGAAGERLKVPHVGWNEVGARGADPRAPLRGTPAAARHFYFVHSYYCELADSSWTSLGCEHGVRFCAAMAKDRVLAVQFHPEKSGAAGHELLRAFVEDRPWS
jgi:glutamine amidotransferase